MDKLFQERLDSAINKIEFSRQHIGEQHIVKVIAVSKYSDSNAVKAMYGAGQRAFGENRVQDLREKMEALKDLPIEWHFMGNLQKNKINQLIDLDPFLMHSLSSLELAKALNERLEKRGKTMRCLLQVNSAYEESKSGVSPEDAERIYETIQTDLPAIKLKGIMTIGAHTQDRKLIKESFDRTNKISQNLKSRGAKICSMGMSADFELAIESGSNMVRLGSVLFK